VYRYLTEVMPDCTIQLLTLSEKSLFYLSTIKMNNLVTFLREAWAELKKVVWPSKSKTIRLTGVVLAITFVVAGYIALLDLLFNKLLTFLVEK